VKRFLPALVCLLFIACGDAPNKPVAAPPPAETTPTSQMVKLGKRDAREDCSSNAGGAAFAGGFTNPENLVVGPLVIVGGSYLDRDGARLLGSQRFLVLVLAGHTVTVRLAPEARTLAGLAYGRHRDGKVKLRDTYRSVTFIACGAEESTSDIDGADATLWSGYVLTRRPECVPLEVSIDGGAPQRVGLTLGARC
jgi:hypothetical protein